MISTALYVLVFGLIAGLALPWWGIGVAGFAAGAWRAPTAWKALGAGFGGAGILWLTTAGYVHLKSGGILTGKIAGIAGLSDPSLLVVITALIGGLVAALAAVTGYHLRLLLKKP
ncbi:MAG: hypothetical protein OXU79_15755 [Gemmatimonadota bacterium]|nr:hypothetical protein [Gemmatimonadota bacterium]